MSGLGPVYKGKKERVDGSNGAEDGNEEDGGKGRELVTNG